MQMAEKIGTLDAGPVWKDYLLLVFSALFLIVTIGLFLWAYFFEYVDTTGWVSIVGNVTKRVEFDYNELSRTFPTRQQKKGTRVIEYYKYTVNGAEYTGMHEYKIRPSSQWKDGTCRTQEGDAIGGIRLFYNPKNPSKSTTKAKESFEFHWYYLYVFVICILGIYFTAGNIAAKLRKKNSQNIFVSKLKL